MSEPFIAQIEIFGGNYAPQGWAFCHGQILPISSNTALFSLLGTVYGGDGRTSFGLPDLRGRAPVGTGTGPGLTNRRLGAKGGAEDETLSNSQMPVHNHTVSVASSALLGAQTGDADQHVPSSTAVLATPIVQNTAGLNIYSTQSADTDIEGAEMNDLLLAETGGGQSHTNLQPLLVMNYIIALTGVFPQRN